MTNLYQTTWHSVKYQFQSLEPSKENKWNPILPLAPLIAKEKANDKRAFFLVFNNMHGAQIFELVAGTATERKTYDFWSGTFHRSTLSTIHNDPSRIFWIRIKALYSQCDSRFQTSFLWQLFEHKAASHLWLHITFTFWIIRKIVCPWKWERK